MAEQGKSTVRFTEWKIEKNAQDRLLCAKYETVTTDGVEAPPEKVREEAVPPPDLCGADIERIARFAMRFNFNIADLADQCRESDYQANARRLQSDLIAKDKRAGL